MTYCIDFICAIFVSIVNVIFYFLPIRFVLWMGRFFGTVAYHVNVNRKVIGYANLRAAFCKEKTPRELKKLIKGVYQNLVETVFEIIALYKVNEKYIDKYVDIGNPENMLKIVNHPKGIIFLTAHFGNWELAGMTSSMKGFPLVVLAREQRMKRMNELINRLRESKGVKVVRKGLTTKNIVKALHQGEVIGMVGDQDGGKDGILTEFFERLVSTASGSARIAQKTGAYILPAFMARVKGPYHRLIIEEPIKIEKDENIEPYLVKYNTFLEKYVRAYPEQWLWLHKRWKSTPLKKVVILSDGKKGHLNQALGAYKKLKSYRIEMDHHSPDDTHAEIVEVKYRNKFTKVLLDLASIFANHSCQGCMVCLKFCLTKDSYENLMSKYADIVISCGSGTVAVNRFFSIENNAKNALIMKPSFLGTNKFNMVVLPRHDAPDAKPENVIITDVVPSLIDETTLTECARTISKSVDLKKDKKIGVLLGGDNSDFSLTEEITENLLNNVINASDRLDADLLFTTSRRTPDRSSKLVKNKLHSEKCCKMLVIANEDNNPDVVGGILGLSDVVVVSGESVSMISEAVSSGKRVIVFKLKKNGKKTSKFEKMLNNLEEKGYVAVTEAENLSEAIYKAFSLSGAKTIKEKPDDIYMHMWRLL